MDTLQLCLFFFFSEQANGEKMEHQPITPAEHTSHNIAEQTRRAIIWTGGVQAIIAALAAIFGLWKLLIDEQKEEKKEEEDQQQAREIRDQLAALGKRLADLEVKEMAEEGKKRAAEEEMEAEKEKKKVEREKKEKRKDAADKQHEIASAALGKRLDDIEEQQRLQIKEHSEKVELLKSKHESDMRLKDNEISDLREKNATMLRLIRLDHPGWAPGVTSGTTGG